MGSAKTRLGRSNYGGILTKGTTSERDAISSPSSGDTHYNTTTNQMNIYADGSWNEFTLTIPSNQLALLSGSSPPTANNNNVFYKNTNPYNLQVYRNAWKILPLELTNAPSFSYGLTVPSNSSGNTGNVFYDTSNQIINLYRNNEWISIFSRLIGVGAGGIETSYSNYQVHSFLTPSTSSTFTVSKNSITVDILIVGGGGGGYPGGSGCWEGGGGGAGELIFKTNLIMSVGVYTITVGAGGGSGSNGNSTQITGQGLNNNNGYTAKGGGTGSRAGAHANDGGSGGGSGHTSTNSSNVGNASSGTPGVSAVTDTGELGNPDRMRLNLSTSAVNQVGHFAYSGGYKNSSSNIGGGGGGAGGHGALGTTTSPGGLENSIILEPVMLNGMLVVVVVVHELEHLLQVVTVVVVMEVLILVVVRRPEEMEPLILVVVVVVLFTLKVVILVALAVVE